MTTLRPSAALALFACMACGSSSDSKLYSGHIVGTGGERPSSGGTQATGAGSRAGLPGGGGGAGLSGIGAGGSLIRTDAALGGGGGISAPDAGSPRTDSGASLDAPTPGDIFCAGTQCTIAGTPTNTCCVGFPPFPTACLPSFPGCVNAGVAAIACDDAADCLNGQICCGNLSGQNAGAKCAATCPSPSIQVCRTSAECRSGRCAPLAQARDYGACQ